MNPWTRRGALVAALLGASLGGASVATAQPAPDAGLVAEPSCVKPKGKITVTLAPQLRLQDLVSWAHGFTCKTFVYDARLADRLARVDLTASVTASSAPMTPTQAYRLFQEVLRALNVKAVGKGAVVRLMDTSPATPACAAGAPGQAAVAPVAALDDEDIAAAVEAGIKKLDDTHVTISRLLLDQVLANPMAVAKGARVVPVMQNGKPDGFKLYAIRPESIYAKLGFANGDTIRLVNGFDLTSAEKSLDVYTKLREATSVQVDLIRRGKPVTLTISIK